jgi:MFS family permease
MAAPVTTAPATAAPATGSTRRSRVRAEVGSFARVVRQPVLRRVLPAMLISAIGDGMSLVAVAWLALTLAPTDQQGTWTGLAVAAYALPATIGAVLFGRVARRLRSVHLVAVDASLRAVSLGLVAGLAVTGLLNLASYVALLALSSLMHAWGNAGAYTLIAELLPDEDRANANALMSTFGQGAIVLGPALAGGLTALAGPGWVIGADAASFALLAASCWRVAPGRAAAAAEPAQPSGWRSVMAHRRLAGLVGVTCVFYFLYGPVEVALPIHVAQNLGGSPALLGAFWAVLGIGATVGGLGAGLLRRHSLWLVVVAIIIGWGLALLPVGLQRGVALAMAGFAMGGLVYGPFMAISALLFQRTSPPHLLSRILATRAALTTPSTAAGTLLGGPVVAAIGSQRTLLASAVATIMFGALAAAVLAAGRCRSAHPVSLASQEVTSDSGIGRAKKYP